MKKAKKINSFSVIAFKQNTQTKNVITNIYQWSTNHGVPVCFHPILKNIVPNNAKSVRSEQELIQNCEALISIGGDGTFLAVVHMSHFSQKPIVGINLGGLGFLTEIGPENLEKTLSQIHQGNYSLAPRMILHVDLIRNKKSIKTFQAFNDIFVNRYIRPKLTMVSAWYGQDFISDFQGDGLIISTPNGSTAYSLAAGGPIVEPSVRAFVLNPICPHSLTERAIILPSDKEIRLVISRKNPNLILNVDGFDSIKLKCGDEIIISFKGTVTNVIQLSNTSYFELLRKKLSWGKDYKRWRDNHR